MVGDGGAVGGRRGRVLEVVGFAAAVRVAVLLVSWCAVSIFQQYDSSLQLHFSNHCPALIQALATWDGVYFSNIACEGYAHEQNYAFFPGLAAFGLWARRLQSVPSCRCAAAASIQLAGFLAFLAATAVLYQLTYKVFGRVAEARVAALLFAVNPALPFFGAAYTEAVFALLIFSGLYCLYAFTRPFAATALFALATCVRSNGLVASGFVVHHVLSTSPSLPRALMTSITAVAATAVPLVLFQYTAYRTFCTQAAAAAVHSSRPSSLPPWCTATPPSIYAYIQRHYWAVGFLRQYKLSQVPNFILAAPVLAASAAAVAMFTSSVSPSTRATLALGGPIGSRIIALWRALGVDMPGVKRNSGASDGHSEEFDDDGTQLASASGSSFWQRARALPARQAHLSALAQRRIFVVAVYHAFLALFALLNMHVQVSTRLLCSASPLLYWFGAHVLLHRPMWRRLLVLRVCLGYAVVGAVLHALFLPWT